MKDTADNNSAEAETTCRHGKVVKAMGPESELTLEELREQLKQRYPEIPAEDIDLYVQDPSPVALLQEGIIGLIGAGGVTIDFHHRLLKAAGTLPLKGGLAIVLQESEIQGLSESEKVQAAEKWIEKYLSSLFKARLRYRNNYLRALIREYLETNYRDVTESLKKEARREWLIGAPEEELSNLSPLQYFLYKSFQDWERAYGDSVIDVGAVSVPDVYRSVEDTLQEWATAYGFSLKDRGPAIYPRELAPYLSTSKIARRFHVLEEQTEFKGGRSTQLQHRRFSSAITAPDATSALELSQTHVVVSDAIGSLYHSHREETGEQHARFTLTQITQQVMGNPKPTAPQQREVKASIEFLRRHMIHAHGEIVSGERIDYDDFLLSASATSVTNRMGNSVTGYKVRDYPVVFDISRRQEQARQLDALLSPRPGGEWWPSRLEEMTVYHMICRMLFSLTPGKDGYSVVEDKELQQGLGGKYAPEHITARGRRTVREYREAAVKELQARGFIVQYDDYKPSRSVLGARIRIADKFPALKISPDNKRRIERS